MKAALICKYAKRLRAMLRAEASGSQMEGKAAGRVTKDGPRAGGVSNFPRVPESKLSARMNDSLACFRRASRSAELAGGSFAALIPSLINCWPFVRFKASVAHHLP